MKKIFLITILCFDLIYSTQSQNLVSNPGFESYNDCPLSISSVDSSESVFPTVIDWMKPTDGTADFFNQCCTLPISVNVPANVAGFQYAHSGVGYSGFFTYWNNNQLPQQNYHEYLQTHLNEPLKEGKMYCIEFYVSPTRSQWIGPSNYSLAFATDDIGALITDYRPTHWLGGIGPNTNIEANPQIKNPDGIFLSDTALWYHVHGIYLSQGGEQWLTIGNFFTDQNTSLQLIYSDPNSLQDSISYYFLDDVSVSEVVVNNPLNDTIICNNSPFTKTLVAYPYANSYLWNTGDTTQTITVNQTGIYWVIMQTDCGEVTDTVEIKNQLLLNLFAGNDISKCDDGQSILLAATPGFDHYQWNTGDTVSNLNVSQSGMYIVSSSYACGIETDTVEVIINPYPPPPVASDDSLCIDDPAVALTAAGENLLWYESVNNSTGEPMAPVPSTTSTGVQSYFVSQTVAGCESEKAEVNVIVAPPPVVDLKSDSSICEGTSLILQVNAPYAVINWSNGSTENEINVTDSGCYKVSAVNWCGSSADSIYISIINCDACIIMPNVFTPNGDGINDQFLPIIKCPVISEYIFQIFNRWGQKVFETQDQEEGWNGINRNKSEPMGAYGYFVQYTISETGLRNMLRGNATLLR